MTQQRHFRRRMVVASLLILGILAVLFIFRHEVVGRTYGESKYGGHYTNYWKEMVASKRYVVISNNRANAARATHLPAASLWERTVERTGLNSEPLESPLFLGDPDGMPVLLELLNDKDARVRKTAVWGLFNLGIRAQPALSALLARRNDEDDSVREVVELAISKCQPEEDELTEEELKLIQAKAPERLTEKDRDRLRKMSDR